MKIDGAITILINGSDDNSIEIHDVNASTLFAKITLTDAQLASALSRLGRTSCEIEVKSLDRVGKRHEVKKYEFELPGFGGGYTKEELNRICLQSLEKAGWHGWTPDKSYSSQDSFFKKDDKHFARTNIRRWN